MAKQLQLRGGTTAQHAVFTGAAREITVNTDTNALVVHDGATPGGFPVSGNAGSQLSSDITVTVGTGGDYSTINEALDYLVKTYQPIYKNTGVTATINLLTGFVMAEQVLVYGLDLGWIQITGVDAETTITHTSFTERLAFEDYPAFGVTSGGTLPTIAHMFRFSTEAATVPDTHGIMAYGAGSSANISRSGGVADAIMYGIYANNGSTINVDEADVSGAGECGIYVAGGSTVAALLTNCSNAGDCGIAVDSGSTVTAQYANCSNAGGCGIAVNSGSTVTAQYANCSGAGEEGIYVGGSSIADATNANCSNTVEYGIRVVNGSTINASMVTGTLSQTANTLTSSGIIFQ